MTDRPQRRLAAIVSADVVGYSRLMGTDETGTLTALRAHRAEMIDEKIDAYGGRIVKTMGDGLLLEYSSVVDAVQSMIDVQLGMVARNEDVEESRRIEFRIGVNLGDIIIEDHDILGDGVNIAARLQEISTVGGIAVSQRVHDVFRDRLDHQFADGGELTLKNIARPVHIWRWLPDGEVPQAVQVVGDSDEAAVDLKLPDKPSIAVLPFDNMSGDPEQEFFVDGVVEDVLTTLSKIPSLFVIARNSRFKYKNQSPDLLDVGRELGVRYVLEGSVRKAGNRVRVTAQLIDTSDRKHVWADRYDGELDDVFDLQDRLTQEIVTKLEVNLTEGEQVAL